ncbi:hypothetical protein KKG83_00165 [Candidatus Micrarchaeota archaeon]|nr:hypothetical protein [Candidatus Micrarchaeota archaeon]MBU2475866.1 hypothetical protein [Candidatus Micrarchaeota archaeon]
MKKARSMQIRQKVLLARRKRRTARKTPKPKKIEPKEIQEINQAIARAEAVKRKLYVEQRIRDVNLEQGIKRLIHLRTSVRRALRKYGSDERRTKQLIAESNNLIEASKKK